MLFTISTGCVQLPYFGKTEIRPKDRPVPGEPSSQQEQKHAHSETPSARGVRFVAQATLHRKLSKNPVKYWAVRQDKYSYLGNGVYRLPSGCNRSQKRVKANFR